MAHYTSSLAACCQTGCDRLHAVLWLPEDMICLCLCTSHAKSEEGDLMMVFTSVQGDARERPC